MFPLHHVTTYAIAKVSWPIREVPNQYAAISEAKESGTSSRGCRHEFWLDTGRRCCKSSYVCRPVCFDLQSPFCQMLHAQDDHMAESGFLAHLTPRSTHLSIISCRISLYRNIVCKPKPYFHLCHPEYNQE